jgi:hypothetical protein
MFVKIYVGIVFWNLSFEVFVLDDETILSINSGIYG